jgi:hypothetical protein
MVAFAGSTAERAEEEARPFHEELYPESRGRGIQREEMLV